MPEIVIFGGTSEGRKEAEKLLAQGRDITVSVTSEYARSLLPHRMKCHVGILNRQDMLAWLSEMQPGLVIDATHPFAIRVSTNAAEACTQAGVPLLRLVRPGWENEPAASRWIWVDDHDEAAWQAARLGRRVLLTTGRQTLHHFIGPLAEHTVLARVVEDVELALPPTWILIRSRGPYTCAGERKLMAEHAVEVLVTKDSGGVHTRAKLDAADELGVSVVVVRRPLYRGDVPTVADVPAALEWLGLSQTR